MRRYSFSGMPPFSRMDTLKPAVAQQVIEAVEAVADGQPVVYPTETVYGLGARALTPETVSRVFEIKTRDRSNPLSLGVHSIDAALEHTHPNAREERFIRRFLPGPVTVVTQRADSVPDVLTAGRERVGIRVPDQPVATALLSRTGPLTATSANKSGHGSVRRLEQLDESVRNTAGAVIDTGETPGTESTVVDPGKGIIHRPGAGADAIESWLDNHEANNR